jgi:hypothetical protein
MTINHGCPQFEWKLSDSKKSLPFKIFTRENSKDKNRRRCFQGYRVSHREVISDYCVLFVLSTEYRWFSNTSVCCCTPMIWSCFFPSKVFRIWTNCPSEPRNSLFLNVDKRITITFLRTRYPVEFTYMLGGSVLDRVNSINDLGVIMDEKMNISDHIDVMV